MTTDEVIENQKGLIEKMRLEIDRLSVLTKQQTQQITQMGQTVTFIVGDFMKTLGDLMMAVQEQPQAGIPTQEEAMHQGKATMNKYMQFWKESNTPASKRIITQPS